MHKSAIRSGTATDRLLDNERSPNVTQDEPDVEEEEDEDLMIVEDEEDYPPGDDVNDDEDAPLTSAKSSLRKPPASDTFQHFLKPRRPSGARSQRAPHVENDRNETGFNIFQRNTPEVTKQSRPEEFVTPFGNSRPESTSLLGKGRSASKSSQPFSKQNLEPVHQDHQDRGQQRRQPHSRIDFPVSRNVRPGRGKDGESQSRGDNQNGSSTDSALPPFSLGSGRGLSLISGGGRQPRAGRGEDDDDEVAAVVGGWTTHDLDQHREFTDLRKDGESRCSGKDATPVNPHEASTPSTGANGVGVVGSPCPNSHSHVHPQSIAIAVDHLNHIPVSPTDVSRLTSPFKTGNVPLAPESVPVQRHHQNGTVSVKSPNQTVVDLKNNLVDKNQPDPAMDNGVVLESYTALNGQHKDNGYLDANKNGPTKETMDMIDERKVDISNGTVPGTGAGHKIDDQQEDDGGGPCGWGFFQFEFCQRFRNPLWFLVVLTLCGACQGMAVNGFVNTVISTIEKRYEISSTESGLIASCYDIVFVLLVIPVSYFGGHGHKPRYLGIGILILGIGSFVFALPHFISASYVVENAEDTVCKRNSNASDQCATTEGSGLSNYKYFFFLGQGLHGAGATALYTLGVTYMDENVPQRVSSFYNGIFYTGAIIGPAIGYMVGAEFLNIYTEVSVDSTALGLDPSNPKWVGAWWIGFLISGAMGVLLALPLLAYPSALPGSKKYAAERGREAQAMKSEDQTGKSLGIKDCLLSIKLLLTNIPFMFINLAAAADGVLVAGFSTFMPKFIEYQFGVSAATAALYVGLAVVPAGGGATFAGGFIVRFFNLKVRGILRLCTIMSFFLFVLAFSLLMECDTGPFAGVTLPYGQTDVRLGNKSSNATFMGKSLENSCNQDCRCEEEDYFPMCGRDNVMYFSPCYAGCTASKHDGDVKMYYNCSCISYELTKEDWEKGTTHMGVFGKCEYKCKWLTLFMVLFTFMIVFVFITSMPSLTATLRCVPDHQRSFGLGLQWIVARCLGSIPGPILFGKMFDLACLVWQKRCDGEGSCFYYDNHNMSINLMILALVFSLIAALTFLIALCFYKVQDESDDNIKIKSEIDLEVFTTDKSKDESLPSLSCNSEEKELELKNENHSR